MCWKGKLEDYRVAKEPIYVIKMLYKVDDVNGIKYQAPYQKKFYYRQKNTYHNDQFSIKFVDDNRLEISRGFHSYAFDHVYKIEKDDGSNGRIHYCMIYLEKDQILMDYRGSQNLVACKGIIPKGSHYFINDTGEIVSDSIHLIEEIKLTDGEIIINEKSCVG